MKVENASKWPQQDCKLMSESVACGRPLAFLAKPLVGSSRQLDRLAQSWQGWHCWTCWHWSCWTCNRLLSWWDPEVELAAMLMVALGELFCSFCGGELCGNGRDASNSCKEHCECGYLAHQRRVNFKICSRSFDDDHDS